MAEARFNRVRGIALVRNGNLFVVDTGNRTIRIGQPDPALQATLAGGQMILAWPSWSTNFQLETSAELPATHWSPVPASPVVVGDWNLLSNSVADSALFFRLRSP